MAFAEEEWRLLRRCWRDGSTFALFARRAKVRAGAHEEGTEFTIRRIHAGKLLLPTGRICVTDAYRADTWPPLNRIVPAGEYGVELVIEELPDDLPFGNDRCTFAVVTFGADAAGAWEPATAVEPADPNFTGKRPNGFVQSGGTGLLSPEAAVFTSQLEEVSTSGSSNSAVRRTITAAMTRSTTACRRARRTSSSARAASGTALTTVSPDSPSTGGRVTHLVIDFGIADPSAG